MKGESNATKPLRFGPFEAHIATGELLKDGRVVRLQDQPFQVLRVLLEHPGELVTREQLREQIWGEDTYVDFDRSLNTAVARLREALGDSPNRPTYIETVPRKGYRFVAQIGAQAESEVAQPQAVPSERSRGHRRSRLGLLVAGVATATALTGFYWTSSGPQEPSGPPPAPERLTPYVGAEDEPTFSPDGSHFAFTWNGEREDNYDIYVRTVAGGAPLRLTDHPNRDSSPVWSPDGQWISFWRRLDDGTVDVLRVSPVGGREEKVVSLPGQGDGSGIRRMAWAPDSEHLVIVARAEETDRNKSIFLLDLNSGSHRKLVDIPEAFQPSLSPDGRYLAYALYGTGCFILPLSDSLEPAGDPDRVDIGQSCFSPVWTFDGTRLMMEVGFDGSLPGLWSARPDGSDPKSLHVSASSDTFLAGLRAAVGPNGRLAFRQDLTRQSIWRLDLLSGEAAPLIESSGMNTDAAYCPDGSKIVFRSTRGPNGVWIANADGRNASLLVEGGADARCSPDGTQVAFRALEPGNPTNSGPQDIWVIDAQGGPATNLTNAPSREAAPMWSRDGAWIYFLSIKSETNRGLWKMPTAGGEPEVVLEEPLIAIDESHDGRWLYVATGFSAAPIVARISADGEREVLVENAVGWAGHSVGADGLYYQAGSADSGYEIRFYRFEDRSTSVVYRMTGRAGASLDLSPDGRYLLFSQIESQQSDLMLIEGFE